MSEIGVVHLVRSCNGLEPLKKFLNSYVSNPGGKEHELIIIYKGFGSRGAPPEYRALLREIPHRSIAVADRGYAIGAYLSAANAFPNKYLCFLTSFSVILDRNWLLRMHEFVSRDDVGLVGASGSWESLYSNHLQNRPPGAPWFRSIAHTIRGARLRAHFDPFPNPSIRTNAFIIERKLFLGVRRGALVTKMDAHRFESGKDSLTKQVLETNLKALVVGRDGRGYEKEEWHRSRTFRLGDQGNLLVADNQTNSYMMADPAVRQKLAHYAWGDEANREGTRGSA